MDRYVSSVDLAPGMLIYRAYSSSTPSRVVEVGEPTHGLAALGCLRVVAELYTMDRGWMPPRPFTAWPADRFRVEGQPEIWQR